MLRRIRTYLLAFLALANLIVLALPYILIYIRFKLKSHCMKRAFRKTLEKTGISRKTIVEMEKMFSEALSEMSDFRKFLSMKHYREERWRGRL